MCIVDVRVMHKVHPPEWGSMASMEVWGDDNQTASKQKRRRDGDTSTTVLNGLLNAKYGLRDARDAHTIASCLRRIG